MNAPSDAERFVMLENDKFALVAMDVDASLGSREFDIGHRLAYQSAPPIDLAPHLREWLGSGAMAKLESCGVFFVTSMNSAAPEILDDESAWLEYRADTFVRMLVLASVGFHQRYGQLLVGTHLPTHWSIRSSRVLAPVVPIPGTPRHFTLVTRQIEQADRLVSVLWEAHAGHTHSRLWRALRAFDAAMRMVDMPQRLHELVRAIEGVVPIPRERQGRSQREWFADKVALLWAGTPNREQLLALYDARGATEHLALPMRDLQRKNTALTTAEAEVEFAALVFLAEGLARHALIQVLESEVLRRTFETEEEIYKFWAQDDAAIRTAWGSPLDVAKYLARFDAVAAHEAFARGREERQHYRALLARAPDAYRGVAVAGTEDPR